MISGLSDSDEDHVRKDVAANSEQTAAVSDQRLKLLMREIIMSTVISTRCKVKFGMS